MNIHRIAKLVVVIHAVEALENRGKINGANTTGGSEEEVLIELGR